LSSKLFVASEEDVIFAPNTSVIRDEMNLVNESEEAPKAIETAEIDPDLLNARLVLNFSRRLSQYKTSFNKLTATIQNIESGGSVWSELVSAKSEFNDDLFGWIANGKTFESSLDLFYQFDRGSQGIAMTTGNRLAPLTLVAINVIRSLNCTLPIEVFYDGEEDLNSKWKMHFSKIPNLTMVNYADIVNTEGFNFKSWSSKPFCILFSSFQKVIFVDSDAIFFQNPEILLPLLESGNVFFRDRGANNRDWIPKQNRFIKEMIPSPSKYTQMENRIWKGTAAHEMESGVLVIDKLKSFVSLLATATLNYGTFRKIMYSKFYGTGLS
jgi:hypothetical protein